MVPLFCPNTRLLTEMLSSDPSSFTTDQAPVINSFAVVKSILIFNFAVNRQDEDR